MSESRDRAEAKEQKAHIDSVPSGSSEMNSSDSSEDNSSGETLYYDPWNDVYFRHEEGSESSDSQISEDEGFLW